MNVHFRKLLREPFQLKFQEELFLKQPMQGHCSNSPSYCHVSDRQNHLICGNENVRAFRETFLHGHLSTEISPDG